MGLFDKFRKKAPENSADNSKCIADIFRTICKGKENIAAVINECTNSPIEYAAKNEMQFSERGISPADTDRDMLMWIGCVDILINNAYAAEFDHSCELEDLIFFLNKLTSFADGNITLDENGFSPDEDITVWLEEIDKYLAGRHLCMGGIDIDSDSYVLFLTDIQTLGELKERARSIGKRIDYAKNL